MSNLIDSLADQVLAGRDLTRREAADVFAEIMSGRLADQQIERLLAALADKGEAVDEIVGAAEAMRRQVLAVECADVNAIDTCGTGGDGISTFNVSTAAAIVAAGAGATVAKHGNRTTTRKSGSAEVMRALGVHIDAPPEVVTRCICEAGIGFLYAAQLHPAMKHALAARKNLGRRTIFNLLGPLTNPAGVRRQVVGVPSTALLDKIGVALGQLGAAHALIVHGHGGVCDFSISGTSHFVELREGRLRAGTISPEDVGLISRPIEAVFTESPEASADIIRAILAGEAGPCRDCTLLNAAAALVVAGIASSFAEGVTRAAAAIDSGAAARKLALLVEITSHREDGAIAEP
jgi:anthranilate phosphoribosyltransferase